VLKKIIIGNNIYTNNFDVLWYINKDELLANWELAQNGELPFNIEPLK
jgi:hypothetical protein